MARKSSSKTSVLDAYKNIVSEQSMFTEYKKSNISREYVELFNEFSKTLMYSLHKTYLGKEYIKTEDDINGHFNWCLNNCIDKFKTLNFDFSKNQLILDYFFQHATTHIYDNKKYDENCMDHCVRYFDELLSYYRQKTEKDLILMTELYLKFFKSI